MAGPLQDSQTLSDHIWTEELAARLGIEPQATHAETCAALEEHLGWHEEGHPFRDAFLRMAAPRLGCSLSSLERTLDERVKARPGK